jgi:Ca-activated chloride channel family protein
MKFLWPSALLLLVLLPILVLMYVWVQRRRRRFTIHYSSVSLLRNALPKQSRFRRHLPAALFILMLASLFFGLARPVAITLVPNGRATVMLVMDVSRSMLQNDITPNRFLAAKTAALSFVERQKENNRIGIVAFASIAQLIQPPTTEPEELELSINNLTTGRGTAIGSGILTALDTIAEFNQEVAVIGDGIEANVQVTPVAEGEFVSDIIVLLTDGANSRGIEPIDAAQYAVDRGVRIYTIGYGTTNGGGGLGNNNFGEDFNYYMRFDEASLIEIADSTGGEYYKATSADELLKVFAELPTYLSTREETVEISVLFVAIASLLLIISAFLSLIWRPLP